MTTLRVLVGVGCLLAIMGIAVFVLLGRAVVFCVQSVGKLGATRTPDTSPLPARPLTRH